MLTRALACLAAAGVLAAAVPAATSGPLNVTAGTCASNRVCLRWPPALADGFEYLRDGTRVSNTWDGTRTSVTFQKLAGTHVYTVVPVTRDFAGSVTVPTPPPPPPAETGNAGPAYSPTTAIANVWVATTGSDSTCVRSSQPVAPSGQCRSFQRAYTIAELGDTVGVQPGAYPAQTLTDAPGKTGAAPMADVTFTPQTRSTVTVRSLDFGSSLTADDAADHITVNGVASDEVGGTLTHTCSFDIGSAAYDVTLNYVHVCRFYIQGATDATIQNSEIGPCLLTPAPEYCYSSFVDSHDSPPTRNVTLRNNTIHDYTTLIPNAHFQCLFVLTAVHVTSNRFFHCPGFNIFFQANANTRVNPFAGTLIENNWFAATGTGLYQDNYVGEQALSMPPSSQTGDSMIVRYNSFGGGSKVYWGSDHATNSAMVGNILGGSFGNTVNCAGGTGSTNGYNVYVGADTCGGVGEFTTTGYQYVVDTAGAALDYHLTGPPAPGDDHVPCAAAPYDLKTDYDGDPRPAGVDCDAGSDERR